MIELEIGVEIKVSTLFKSKTFLKTPERETKFCITYIYLIWSKYFHKKKSSSELFNGVHCLSALYLVRNLLTKLIEFQTVPCHSFLFVQFWKISILIRSASFCSVSFLFVSYRFKYKLLAIHSVPFRSVSFPNVITNCV